MSALYANKKVIWNVLNVSISTIVQRNIKNKIGKDTSLSAKIFKLNQYVLTQPLERNKS